MAAATSPRGATFNPVDTSVSAPSADEVESPSLSTPTALARFEFESGRGNNGTKVLMVEWEDDGSSRQMRGDWHVSWEGKTTVLSADDQDANAGECHRLYFLLPPGVGVPATVTLKKKKGGEAGERTEIVWRTNPLPAIFPPELGASATQMGKKGVLHTIWAKKRLQALQDEIKRESVDNVEGVALVMAVQEKEWIESNFGVVAKPHGVAVQPSPGDALNTPPISPRSPGGGRLMEKLKGLKLGTSDRELGSSDGQPAAQNPLSPESSDVAVSSFAAFKGENPAQLAAKPAQAPAAKPPTTRIAAQVPPPAVLQQQQEGFASLNAFAPAPVPRASPAPGQAVGGGQDEEEDLFALPISPRSPEMGKSPFSFTASDTMRYVKS